MDYIILLVFLLTAGWLSYYISKRVFLLLQKKGNRNARELRLLIGIALFVLICFIAFYLLVVNADMER